MSMHKQSRAVRVRSQLSTAGGPARPRRRAAAIACAVEAMENRLLFSAISWVGASGDWATAANWSGGAIPGYLDTVTIPAGANVTVSSSDTCATIDTAAGSTFTIESSGSFSIGSSNTFDGTLNLNGYMTGTQVTVAGTTTVTGTNGYFNHINVANTGNITFVNGGGIEAANFTNSGTMTVDNGIDTSAAITNAPSAVINITGNVGFESFNSGDGIAGGTLINQGTFNQTGATGVDVFDADAIFVNQGGTVNINSGTFQDPGNAFFAGGTINVATGAVFELNNEDPTAPENIGVTGVVSGSGGGHIVMATGYMITQTYDDQNLPGTLDFPKGYVQVGDVNITRVDYSPNLVVNTGYLNFDSATECGPISLVNDGTIQDTGAATFVVETIDNAASGLFILKTDAPLTRENGNYGVITNEGVFRKSIATGNADLTCDLQNNGGTVQVEAGTLTVGGTTTWKAGPIDLSPGTVLDFASPSIQTQGTFAAAGGGTVTFTSGMLLDGSATPTDLDFAANTFYVEGGDISDGSNDAQIVNTGYIYYQGTNTLDGFTNRGKVVFDAGPLEIFNFYNDSGGVMNFTADTAVSFHANNTIVNQGTILKSGGSGVLDLSALGDALNNEGTIDAGSGSINLPTSENMLSSSNTVLNSGQTFIVAGGASITFGSTVDIGVNQATIELLGPGATFSNLASTLTSNVGELEVSGGATFASSGDISNSGLIVAGPSSTLTVNGNYTQVSGAKLKLIFGGAESTGLFGKVAITGSASLTGILHVSVATGYFPTPGDVFQPVTYASETGAFSNVAGQPIWYSEATNATNVTISDSTNGVPYVVSGVLTLLGTRNADTMSVTAGGGDYITDINGVSTSFPESSVTAITALGGPGADHITIGAGVIGASLSGGGGADTLAGGAGNDTINGGLGNNSITGGAGDDLLSAGPGNDTILGGGGNDTINGGGGNDSLGGGMGDDSITGGGAGSAVIEGGAGNDTIDAAGGTFDTINGGAGTDSVIDSVGSDFITNVP